MNKLNAMTTFVQIAEAGSLTKAADALDTSLPTVVRTLANLESHLDTRLMNRTTRKVTLTEEGRLYLQRCRKILFEIEQTELELSALQGEPSGKITLTASPTFGAMYIMELLGKFTDKYKKVNVEIVLSDHNVNLVEEGIDVAVRIGHLSDSSMIAKPVGYLRKVVCGTPKLLNKLPSIAHPHDLVNAPCIRFSGLGSANTWRFFEDGQPLDIVVNGPVCCNQTFATLSAVQSGMGLGTFLSYMVDKPVAAGDLQIILSQFEPKPIPVHVVFSHAKLMSTRVRVFVDWLTMELRKEFEHILGVRS